MPAPFKNVRKSFLSFPFVKSPLFFHHFFFRQTLVLFCWLAVLYSGAYPLLFSSKFFPAGDPFPTSQRNS